MSEMTGDYMVKLAIKWREKNKDAWERMTEIARAYVIQCKRFSMEKLIQHARYDMPTVGFSQGFKTNNNTRAALARMMINENPDFAEYMEIRKSKVDEKDAA